MPISRAEIPVDDAPSLIERLCEGGRSRSRCAARASGCASFTEGTCVLYPEAEKLVVALEALDDEPLDQLEAKVDAALEALDGESLDIVWET
ncbi:DUF2218 domain-containing protein [Billgrantia gudaonensis]|uniref:DUF2218 domain-containing protein n=1 Tax=Billgrantia gudaonensis TaxID=376427 RepID=A0A3S0NEG0_9GAMM|nr:DUF2218 domain-containing protein [Halomonas gudaonensis]